MFVSVWTATRYTVPPWCISERSAAMLSHRLGRLLLLLLGAAVVPQVLAEVRVNDALGRELLLAQPAQRVVSLAPHITELVYAVGAGEQLVGATSFSNYPEAAQSVARVGSSSSVSFESLLALRPDLVVAWRSGNGEQTIARLQALGLNVYVDEPRALADVAHSLRALGQLTGHASTAETAAREYTEALEHLRRTYSERRAVSVYYQIWNEPLLTLNDDHLISDVIRLCGGRNVFAELVPLVSRLSVESVLRADPEVIVASGMDKARPEWLDDWLRWKSMQAVKHGQLYFVPPDLLQRHTPRIVEGATQLCAHLDRARQYYGSIE